MRSEDEIKYALTNVERELNGINAISCLSEQVAAVGHLPKMEAEAGAFRWVLEGEGPELILSNYFISNTHVDAFREFIDHYDDDQKALVDEEMREHYNDWRDSTDPDDEYPGYSENNPEPKVFQTVWIKAEEPGEHATGFDLGFHSTYGVFSFSRWWTKKEAQLEIDAYRVLVAAELRKFMLHAIHPGFDDLNSQEEGYLKAEDYVEQVADVLGVSTGPTEAEKAQWATGRVARKEQRQ